MGGLSTQLIKDLLDVAYGHTAVYPTLTAIRFALSTTPVAKEGTGLTEPGYLVNGYSRPYVANYNLNLWGFAVDAVKTNAEQIEFSVATGDWGLFTHFALMDHYENSAPENFYGYGELVDVNGDPSPIAVLNGDKVTLPPGSMRMSFPPGGGITTRLKNGLLDCCFGHVSYAGVNNTSYVALSRTPILADGTGADEPLGVGGYYRPTIQNRDSYANWSAALDGVKANAVALNFPVATADWGEFGYWMLVNHLSSPNAGAVECFGQILDSGGNPTTVTINSGDQLTLPIGALRIEVE